MKKIENTFGLEVFAEEYISLRSVEEAQRVLPTLKGRKYFIVGGGSNLLFTKRVYDGVIVHLGDIGDIGIIGVIGDISVIGVIGDISVIGDLGDKDSVLVTAPGSMVWDDFVAWCCEKGYWGVENLSYIPGEVGASAVQNIGAYGVEVKDVISRVYTVEVETGKLREFSVEECRYGYRESIFKSEFWQKYLVYAVEFRLSALPKPKLEYKPLNSIFLGKIGEIGEIGEIDIKEIREAIIKIRKEKLPEVGEIGSAGSFFKNPVVSVDVFEHLKMLYPGIPHFDAPDGVKIPAAWLIDNAGLKGFRIGGAMVYEKQPLVIVNVGGATSGEVVAVAQHVIETVYDKYGVRLSPEVNYI